VVSWIGRLWLRQGSASGAAGAAITGGPFMCALANYSYINSLSRGVPNILAISQAEKRRSAAVADP